MSQAKGLNISTVTDLAAELATATAKACTKVPNLVQALISSAPNSVEIANINRHVTQMNNQLKAASQNDNNVTTANTAASLVGFLVGTKKSIDQRMTDPKVAKALGEVVDPIKTVIAKNSETIGAIAQEVVANPAAVAAVYLMYAHPLTITAAATAYTQSYGTPENGYTSKDLGNIDVITVGATAAISAASTFVFVATACAAYVMLNNSNQNQQGQKR